MDLFTVGMIFGWLAHIIYQREQREKRARADLVARDDMKVIDLPRRDR